MPLLIDSGSRLEPINGFQNFKTRIELKLNLLRNKRLDFCPNRADYLNWIPFELCLKIGETESYSYPAEFGAQFSLEELKNLISGTEKLFLVIEEKERTNEDYFKKKRKFEFFTMETYFGLNFKDAHDGLMVVGVQIVMGSLPNSNEGGFERGFRYTVFVSEVKSFISELKEQLNHLIGNNECTCNGQYGCEC